MVKSHLQRFLARHRRNKLITRLDDLLIALHQGYENVNYAHLENGEHFVLQTLREHLQIETVFDVGANVGEWSRLAAETLSDASVYSFEIVPDTSRRLLEQCRDHANIRPFDIGLSDTIGDITVYHAEDRSAIATCVAGFSERFHKYRPGASRVTTTTGDLFCSQHGIDTIDYLKIDVEGHEPNVLRGFQGLLTSEKIKIVQFEYGYANAAVRFLLRDFHEYLGSFNMNIGKIYPNYVDFRDYRFQDENFYGPNYLAVLGSLPSVIHALSG